MDEFKINDLIKAQQARNDELKKLIASKGVRLEQRREIDLHFWASTEQAASDFAQVLSDAGYGIVSTSKVSGSDLWNVSSQIEDTPLRHTID